MIHADTDDLYIPSCEFGQTGFVGWYLTRSYGCPGEREEHQHNGFTAKLCEFDLPTQMTWQFEIWSDIACF